jgi:hypothetical protein
LYIVEEMQQKRVWQNLRYLSLVEGYISFPEEQWDLQQLFQQGAVEVEVEAEVVQLQKVPNLFDPN